MTTENYKSIAKKLKFEGRAFINGKYVDAIDLLLEAHDKKFHPKTSEPLWELLIRAKQRVYALAPTPDNLTKGRKEYNNWLEKDWANKLAAHLAAANFESTADEYTTAIEHFNKAKEHFTPKTTH